MWGNIKAGHVDLDHLFSLYIDYFIGLGFLGNNVNINVVIIICVFFLLEQISWGSSGPVTLVHFHEHVAIG